MIGCSTQRISSQFKTLILPNIAALSDAAVPATPEFVRTGRQRDRDVRDQPVRRVGREAERLRPGRICLVCTFKAQVEGPMQNSYLRLEARCCSGSGIRCSTGLEDAPRIINGVSRVEVEAREARSAHPPLTLIPSYPDLPMEKVYPRVPKTDVPRVFPAEYRQRPSRLFSVGHRSHLLGGSFSGPLKLLRNAVEWATNEEPPVTVTGPACSTSPSGDRRTRSRFIWST